MTKPLVERLSYRCDNRWADLEPRGPGRHCHECDTTVIDLSRLTQKEALARTAGGACVRLRFDGAGAPVFRVEPTRRGGLVVAAALLGGCAGGPAPAPPRVEVQAEPLPETAIALAPAAVPAGIELADLAERATLEATLNDWRHEGGPTPEQLALTAAKRRRLTPPATPPYPQGGPHAEWMGMMDPYF